MKYLVSTKRISRIAVLAALAITLRFAFGSFPNIKPITAIFLVSMGYFSLVDSLLIMALTMVGSGILLGFGVIVLWQIVSFATIMLAWWAVCRPLFEKYATSLLVQAVAAGLLVFVYGLVISFLSASQYGTNPLVYWLNGLIFDCLHALSTTLFYPIIYHIFRRFSL